jgi:hypothetical protein
MLGYLRPAFAALALAFFFCAAVRGLDFPSFLGRFFSHTGFATTSSFSFSCILMRMLPWLVVQLENVLDRPYQIYPIGSHL